MDMNLIKLQEIVNHREAWYATAHGIANRHDLATEQQQYWKQIILFQYKP